MMPDEAPSDLEIVEAFPHDVVGIPTAWNPLSDGTRLAARFRRPAGAGPCCLTANLSAFKDATRVFERRWRRAAPRR